ncbi:MAG TPA: flagellar hook-associated protein FlgK [Gaiellaceae bacterium]|nr:flagellar hook-associated protein FlgK [Gaiellaceae bacterium]
MSISTFTGLETALRGLMAHQQALDVTGENVANASTPGYTRETVSLAATPGLRTAPGVLLGTGVTVTGYERVRDTFLDVQLRAQTMLQGAAEATRDGLSQVEGVIAEPSDTGLGSLLDAYWGAWQDVANAPQDPATRQALVEAASSLADGFRGAASQLQTIQSQTAQAAQLTLQQANDDGATLQSLNAAIFDAHAVGETPNDLLDRRDQVLDDLARLGSIAVTDNGDGTLTVTFDGVTLTAGKVGYTLSESGGTISNSKPVPETAAPSATTGKLGALLALRDVTIPSYRASLDAIAAALIQQTNALHAGGVGLDGSTGNPFFAGTDAATIAVAVTPAQVAAAAPPGAPGDNANALALAGVRNLPVASLGNATVGGAYAQLVTTIGTDAQASRRASENAAVLVDSLSNRRDSVSSVSLDEEMTNLVRFQHGYQASARALSAMDDVIELLITRTGRVGL